MLKENGEWEDGKVGPLHLGILASVLMCESEKVMWRKKERCSIRIVEVNNFSGLMGIRKILRIPNARGKELSLVKKRGR